MGVGQTWLFLSLSFRIPYCFLNSRWSQWARTEADYDVFNKRFATFRQIDSILCVIFLFNVVTDWTHDMNAVTTICSEVIRVIVNYVNFIYSAEVLQACVCHEWIPNLKWKNKIRMSEKKLAWPFAVSDSQQNDIYCLDKEFYVFSVRHSRIKNYLLP